MPTPAEMPAAKLKDFKVFMVAPANGKATRTLLLQAKDKAEAKKLAERNADDIVDQLHREAAAVYAREKSIDQGAAMLAVDRDEPFVVKTVEG